MIKSLSLLSLLALSSNVFSNEIIVKLKPNTALPKFSEIKNAKNLFETTYVIQTDNESTLIEKLSKSNRTIYIQKSMKAESRKLPVGVAIDPNKIAVEKENNYFTDPLVSQVWSFKDAANNGVSVNKAYTAYGTSGTNTTIVAVVDTGVDYNHEELKDVMWTNPGEIPNNGIDDDGNGYIDDIHGINTLIRDKNGNATVDMMDTHSHGTHVSGTIGAAQNNGKGIAGIASNVRIMGIRTVPNNGDERDVDVAEAFIYAAKNGAKIINCSFGKYKNEGQNLIPDTLKYIADNYGVLVIAAAGNETTNLDTNPSYPASFDSENLLVIASTTSTGSMSYFSNYGRVGVDVAAPGSNIYSTVPNNKYESMSGTSMATPTTVGVAAEVLSHYPNLTYKQLKQVLMTSVTKVDKFQTKLVTGGRIDLFNALEIARNVK